MTRPGMSPLAHPPQTSGELIQRIAHVTRMLRESMRELGLDHAIQEAAHAIPDTRDRLHYVARMTEQAANRVLNAAEQIRPMQQELETAAAALTQRWRAGAEQAQHLGDDPDLVASTQQFLESASDTSRRSLELLMDIIMAQDFQDLTGQVIMRMLEVVSAIETELVQVLIENIPKEEQPAAVGLLNGPQVRPDDDDRVSSQGQVDDLLASLGL